MLLKSIEVVATLTLIILLGCFLKHRNIITDKSSKLLASLAVFVAIPSMIFISIIDGYDKKSFIEIAPTILIPMANMIFLYFIALLISKLLRIPKKRIGIFISVITFSNVVLMGFPVASAVLLVPFLPQPVCRGPALWGPSFLWRLVVSMHPPGVLFQDLC
jgi:hypothetical protein